MWLLATLLIASLVAALLLVLQAISPEVRCEAIRWWQQSTARAAVGMVLDGDRAIGCAARESLAHADREHEAGDLVGRGSSRSSLSCAMADQKSLRPDRSPSKLLVLTSVFSPALCMMDGRTPIEFIAPRRVLSLSSVGCQR